MDKVYITTAIPYMNGDPHVGHALDYLQADVLARYYRTLGAEVKFQAGTDEHGNKIFQKARDNGVEVKEFVDEKVQKLKDFIGKLNISYTDFIRTTDDEHIRRCQEIWRRLSNYIYKDKYEGWYCTGCERYATDKEVEECHGVCPDHQKPYEKLEEENYYFRLSDFKEQIYEAISTDELLILPEFRKREMLQLLKDSPDVSISRPRSQLSWGVPVPDDDSQVMYVWIDALSNYITILGYPDVEISEWWWPAVAQFVGKDILRFHAIIWPAMLLGLGLPLPKAIPSHGHVLVDGQKMSKSIGNVVNPTEVIDKYGSEAFRYYFLRHIDTFADSDFSWEKYEKAYKTELANDLGNLVQRLATLISKNEIELRGSSIIMPKKYQNLMEGFEFSKAFDYLWEKIRNLNKRIDDEKPWEMAKNGERIRLEECLIGLALELLKVNFMLSPFLPETSEKISEIFTNPVQAPKEPLFPKN